MINNGSGSFAIDTTALPENHTSKSCVRAADFDKDGDLDLFIAGRCYPFNYPRPVSCILLQNDSKNGKAKFTDITKTAAGGLADIGMICDAVWSDFDKDGWPDLLLAGEWIDSPSSLDREIVAKLGDTTPKALDAILARVANEPDSPARAHRAFLSRTTVASARTPRALTRTSSPSPSEPWRSSSSAPRVKSPGPATSCVLRERRWCSNWCRCSSS